MLLSILVWSSSLFAMGPGIPGPGDPYQGMPVLIISGPGGPGGVGFGAPGGGVSIYHTPYREYPPAPPPVPLPPSVEPLPPVVSPPALVPSELECPPKNPCRGCENKACQKRFIRKKAGKLSHQYPEYSFDTWRNKIKEAQHSHADFEWQSNGKFKKELYRIHQKLSNAHPQTTHRKTSKELGFIAVEEADHSYALGNESDAFFYKDLSQGFLDIAVGLDPITGLGRSAYELTTGKNLITGLKLNKIERSMAFVGVVTAGGSTAGANMWKLMEKASHLLKNSAAIERAMIQGERLIEKAGKALSKSRFYRPIYIESAA